VPVIPFPPQDILETANQLGILATVKRKLVNQPDPAAAKLAIVLEELSKIYYAFDDELTAYTSLFFDESDPKQLRRERAVLAKLEGGAIQARINQARGHCSKIWNIYQRYLTPWFRKVLSRDENEQVEELFRELSDIDSKWIADIDAVAWWLAQEATAAGELVERNDLAKANERVDAARKQLRPLRRVISETMVQMRSLESDVIEISGAV
jgi:hypothetical protein